MEGFTDVWNFHMFPTSAPESIHRHFHRTFHLALLPQFSVLQAEGCLPLPAGKKLGLHAARGLQGHGRANRDHCQQCREERAHHAQRSTQSRRFPAERASGGTQKAWRLDGHQQGGSLRNSACAVRQGWVETMAIPK